MSIAAKPEQEDPNRVLVTAKTATRSFGAEERHLHERGHRDVRLRHFPQGPLFRLESKGCERPVVRSRLRDPASKEMAGMR